MTFKPGNIVKFETRYIIYHHISGSSEAIVQKNMGILLGHTNDQPRYNQFPGAFDNGYCYWDVYNISTRQIEELWYGEFKDKL
jgi:hypothetical protein